MPTAHVESEVKQNPTRFKNLVNEAQEQLIATGMRSTKANEMLEPARDLINDSSFWRSQSEGLAAYLTPDWFGTYRFPYDFQPLSVVNDRFHIKELLPLLSNDGRFYILALSQNSVRLLRGTHYSIDEIELDNVPKNLAEALRDDLAERQLQFHTEAQPGESYRGRRAIFHGQGYTDDSREKKDLLRYFQQIDRGLQEFLAEERVPLILAGVEYLFPIYGEANTYPRLMEEGLAGNPEHISDQDLHDEAWDLVEPIFRERQDEELQRFQQLFGKGQLTSKGIEKIVPAAYFKQIDSLFLPTDRSIWGRFDPENNTVTINPERQPGDEDLLDFAAVHTYFNGGTVFTLAPEDMPDGATAAAIFRFETNAS
jgi:hypothetical protein